MTFQSFDSFEDMMAAIAEAEARANASTSPLQRLIGTEGHSPYWVQTWGDLFIFGKAMTEAELIAKERTYFGDAMDDEEAYEYTEVVAGIVDRYARGYRTGMAYSVACPEGELGDTHVSVMASINDELFEQARDKGWQVDAPLALDLAMYIINWGRR